MDDKEQRIKTYDPRWTRDGPNLLSDANLKIVGDALAEGWICGLHLYCGGGRGGDAIGFSTFQTYLDHVLSAWKGDLLYLWSVPEMIRRNLVLVDARYDGERQRATSLLSPTDLNRTKEYLVGRAVYSEGEWKQSPDNECVAKEFLAVVSCGTGALDACLYDYDGGDAPGWRWLLDAAGNANVPSGRLCVLPFDTIDHPDFYLLRAKRPNEKGEVPLGGAY
jgi:hypothetical protein